MLAASVLISDMAMTLLFPVGLTVHNSYVFVEQSLWWFYDTEQQSHSFTAAWSFHYLITNELHCDYNTWTLHAASDTRRSELTRSRDINRSTLRMCILLFTHTLAHTFVHIYIYIYRSYTQAQTLRNFNLWWSEGSHGTTGKHSTLSHMFAIDDLRKSRGLHLVNAYRHGLYIYQSMPAGVAQSRHTFVGGTVGKMTDTRKQKAEKASEMPIKHSLCVGNMQIGQ